MVKSRYRALVSMSAATMSTEGSAARTSSTTSHGTEIGEHGPISLTSPAGSVSIRPEVGEVASDGGVVTARTTAKAGSRFRFFIRCSSRCWLVLVLWCCLAVVGRPPVHRTVHGSDLAALSLGTGDFVRSIVPLLVIAWARR